MKGIVIVFIFTLFFLYIIFMSIVYILLYNFVEKINTKIRKKYNRKYRRKILIILSDINEEKILNTGFSNKIKRINELLKNPYFEEVLKDTLYFYNTSYPQNKEVPLLMAECEEYIERLIYKYKGGENIKDTKIVDSLGVYRVNKPFINDFLLEVLNSDSLNLKISGLTAIALIGDEDYFFKGLKIASSKDTYINKKIFINIIGDYMGNRESLFRKLISEFNTYSEILKVTIIECFIFFKYVRVKADILEILNNDEESLEVRLASIRYFMNITYDRAGSEIIKLLKNEKFEIRASASKALKNYKSEEGIKLLLLSLKDRNWYVRFNSANTLLDFNLGKNIIDIVEKLNDKYALDILYYAMFERNIIDYEEYVSRTDII
ncbi:MAG: HEAT repeat domain-containing protein [Clostridium sp.]